MAALTPAAPRTPGQKLRARQRRCHLDMTPMAGLGFVLLSFFLFSATLGRPPVLPLVTPALAPPDLDSERCFCHHGTVTIILGRGHQVHYYFGLNATTDPTVPVPELRTTDFSARGIWQVLLALGQQLPEPVVLIKPGPASKYQDVVDMLDELNITGQKRYALTKLTAADRRLLPAAR